MTHLPSPTNGLVLFVKRECETCALVTPLIAGLGIAALYVQDDPRAFAGLDPHDDTSLEHSFRFGIETVPTLLRIESGREVARTVGWVRDEWRELAGMTALGADLPARRPWLPALRVLRGPRGGTDPRPGRAVGENLRACERSHRSPSGGNVPSCE